MRSMFLAVMASGMVWASSAQAAPSETLAGNTVLMRFPNGTTGRWWGNSDGTFVRVIDTKGRMVASRGRWRVGDGNICFIEERATGEDCWSYPAWRFGQWAAIRNARGDTAEVKVVQGR